MVKLRNVLSRQFDIREGVRQGDSLACLLFNISLEKVMRDPAVETRGTIFNKSVQILAYADDKFTYLGTLINCKNDLEEKINPEL